MYTDDQPLTWPTSEILLSLARIYITYEDELYEKTRLPVIDLTAVILGLTFAKASAERVNSKNANCDMFSPADPAFYQNVSATEWFKIYNRNVNDSVCVPGLE